VFAARLCRAAGLLAIALTLSAAEARPDPDLHEELARLVAEQRLAPLVEARKFAVSLVDITDPARPRYAGVNDQVMMYAASLPKIVAIMAAFQRIQEGALLYTPELRQMLLRVARRSSNSDASRVIHMVGFENIARILTSAQYRLYDPLAGGGLWLGKAYGGPNDYWKRDPLHNLSHGATAYQTARFFLLMAQGELVNPRFSAEMREIFSEPEIRHKFVKGLAAVPGVKIARKSGTWKDWHADAGIIEHGGRRYIAVGLVEHPRGGEILERLIGGLDRIVCGGDEPFNIAGDSHVLTR
jgi:beta-lactamase class A